MPIKIVPWEVDNGVAQIYQSPIVATTIVATTGGSCNESRNLFPQAVPFNRSLLTTEFDNLPPHYSMLSLRSPFSGSSETRKHNSMCLTMSLIMTVPHVSYTYFVEMDG